MIGPVGSATAQFALSFVLLHRFALQEFGLFSLLLVLSQLCTGLWTALFCAPLPVLLANCQSKGQIAVLDCLSSANVLGAILVFAIFAASSAMLGSSAPEALLFAGFAAISVLRWYARARAYAINEVILVLRSDIAYSLTIILGIVFLTQINNAGSAYAGGLLLTASFLGLTPFGWSYLLKECFRVSLRALKGYPLIWKQHARWSLIGVMTTEATANAHVYAVSIVLGPAAYAPLAASSLFIRPIQVATNALTEFERSQMAAQFSALRFGELFIAVGFFRSVLVACWLISCVAALALLLVKPSMILPTQYDRHTLLICIGLWTAVALVRLLRQPESVFMQAVGAFRPLAFSSVIAGFVSLLVVLILLINFGPIWSLGGVLFGELIFALLILKSARFHRRGMLKKSDIVL